VQESALDRARAIPPAGPAGGWRLRHKAASTEAERLLASAWARRTWVFTAHPPFSALIRRLESAAVERAANRLRKLHPPAGLDAAERLIWRRAVEAAAVALRRDADAIASGDTPPEKSVEKPVEKPALSKCAACGSPVLPTGRPGRPRKHCADCRKQ
jgi:hypothetical protein